MKETTRKAIDNYVKFGLKPGGFVTAVLANDLLGALGTADDENRRDIFDICNYVYNAIPISCHGSYAIVANWIEEHRERKI